MYKNLNYLYICRCSYNALYINECKENYVIMDDICHASVFYNMTNKNVFDLSSPSSHETT